MFLLEVGSINYVCNHETDCENNHDIENVELGIDKSNENNEDSLI